MMKRMLAGAVLAAVTGAVCAGLAWAQTPAASYKAYVEAMRPKMAVRVLSKDEQAAMKKAVSVWKGSKTEAHLLGVRPFAEAGDPAAMKAMVEGYVHLQNNQKARGASAALATPAQGLIPMAGLWAMATWRQHGPDKDVGKPLLACMQGKPEFPYRLSVTKDYDCGFDTKDDVALTVFERRMANKTRQEWGTMVFLERPLIDASALAMARMDAALDKLENDLMWSTKNYKPEEQAWVASFIASNPEAKKRHDDRIFELAIQQVEKGRDWDSRFIAAYRASDPEHDKKYLDRINRLASRQAYERESFDQQLATAGVNERYSLSQVAVREGGQKATDWWNKFGATLTPGEPNVYTWCNVGVAAACSDIKRDEQLQALREQQPASGGSIYTPTDPGAAAQASIDHNRAVAASNCARADLGANITCNRN